MIRQPGRPHAVAGDGDGYAVSISAPRKRSTFDDAGWRLKTDPVEPPDPAPSERLAELHRRPNTRRTGREPPHRRPGSRPRGRLPPVGPVFRDYGERRRDPARIAFYSRRRSRRTPLRFTPGPRRTPAAREDALYGVSSKQPPTRPRGGDPVSGNAAGGRKGGLSQFVDRAVRQAIFWKKRPTGCTVAVRPPRRKRAEGTRRERGK